MSNCYINWLFTLAIYKCQRNKDQNVASNLLLSTSQCSSRHRDIQSDWRGDMQKECRRCGLRTLHGSCTGPCLRREVWPGRSWSQVSSSLLSCSSGSAEKMAKAMRESWASRCRPLLCWSQRQSGLWKLRVITSLCSRISWKSGSILLQCGPAPQDDNTV